MNLDSHLVLTLSWTGLNLDTLVDVVSAVLAVATFLGFGPLQLPKPHRLYARIPRQNPTRIASSRSRLPNAVSPRRLLRDDEGDAGCLLIAIHIHGGDGNGVGSRGNRMDGLPKIGAAAGGKQDRRKPK